MAVFPVPLVLAVRVRYPRAVFDVPEKSTPPAWFEASAPRLPSLFSFGAPARNTTSS
ncbi:MAG TPA: hypothetical protein VNB06_12345 [Thermoanaerobaculia bacterium]|nr:hypothetical protein [Thermoanaerobaculia bacterium]